MLRTPARTLAIANAPIGNAPVTNPSLFYRTLRELLPKKILYKYQIQFGYDFGGRIKLSLSEVFMLGGEDDIVFWFDANKETYETLAVKILLLAE